MYSYSRDGKTAFMHDPAGGLAIPLLLHLAGARIEIRMPHIEDLAEHYVDASTLRALKEATGDHGALIDAAMQFGQYYSDLFHDQAYGDSVSLRDLRSLIQRHYESIGATPSTRPSLPIARVPMQQQHERLALN